MSVYNAWPYLKDSVESVLAQTYTEFEFMIVDDGSTDEGVAYLDSLDDPRIVLVHKDNEGLGRPLNPWLKNCRGKYIMRVDADDLCAPERMQKQLEYLESHPGVIMLGTQIIFFFGSRFLDDRSFLFTDHDSIVKGMMNGWHTMCHASIMFRRTLFEYIDGYAVGGAGEDWAFLLDASRYGELANLEESLYFVRVHEESTSWNNAANVIRGFAFARKRAQMMANGKELGFTEFVNAWEQRGTWAKLVTQLQARSQVYYRRAVVSRLHGHKIGYGYYLLLSALLDWKKTFGAVAKRYRRLMGAENA